MGVVEMGQKGANLLTRGNGVSFHFLFHPWTNNLIILGIFSSIDEYIVFLHKLFDHGRKMGGPSKIQPVEGKQLQLRVGKKALYQ
jgi:hypothetical protein